MSLILADGFEDGLLSSRYTVTSTPDIGSGRFGNGLSIGTNEFVRYDIPAALQDDELYVGAALKVGGTGSPQPNGTFLTFLADAALTTHITIISTSSGALRAYRGTTGGTQLGQTAGGLLTTSYHFFEFYVKLADSPNGAITIRRDGVEVLALTGIDTKNAGTAAVFDALRMGDGSSAGQFVQYDDLYIVNGDGSAPLNTFLDDVRVETIYPGGNGNSSQLVGSDADSTDNYLLVDEATPSSADYVGSATPADKDTYAFGNLATGSGTVFGVIVNAYAAKSDAGAISGRIVTRSGGTDYASSDLTLATSYGLVSHLQETDPNTAAAWTIAGVNAAEFGWEVRA